MREALIGHAYLTCVQGPEILCTSPKKTFHTVKWRRGGLVSPYQTGYHTSKVGLFVCGMEISPKARV